MIEIQILGTGCPKCNKLAENVKIAMEETGKEYKIDKVTDINKIIGFGVMITPALVVDGEVKVAGKVPGVDEIKNFIS